MKKRLSTPLITLMTIFILLLSVVAVDAAEKCDIYSVNLSKTSVSMKPGQHYGLTATISSSSSKGAKTATWSSNNPGIAEVKSGTIIAKKAGTAVIKLKVSSNNSVIAKCTVTVKAEKPVFVNTSKCYTYLNNYRKAKKIKTLAKDAKLENIAKIRAKEMALKNKFSHTRPNGKSGLSLINKSTLGRKVLAKGENIAKGQNDCLSVSKAWYKSTGHRQNMLRKNFKRVGIAGYKYNGVIYWAQVFSD